EKHAGPEQEARREGRDRGGHHRHRPGDRRQPGPGRHRGPRRRPHPARRAGLVAGPCDQSGDGSQSRPRRSAAARVRPPTVTYDPVRRQQPPPKPPFESVPGVIRYSQAGSANLPRPSLDVSPTFTAHRPWWTEPHFFSRRKTWMLFLPPDGAVKAVGRSVLP